MFIPPRGQLCEETSLQSEITLYAGLFCLSIARLNYFSMQFQMGVILSGAKNLALGSQANPAKHPVISLAQELVARYAEVAAEKIPSLKSKRISPRTIPHTTATHLPRAGVDINTIRAWLGHVSLDTTNIYAETDLAMKAKALAACDPGGGCRRRKRWRDDPNLMEFLGKL